MDEQKKEYLKQIYKESRKFPKGNYNIYSSFSSRVFDLGLTPRECDQALRKLAQILRV